MKKEIIQPPISIFKNIVDEIRDYAIFMMDTEGNVITWNLGAELIKGFKPEEILGRNYAILFPEDLFLKGLPKEEIEIAKRDGRYESENYRKRKDGSLFWAHVLLTKIHDDQGNHVGFTKVTKDLTEKQEYKERLERQNHSLKRMNVDLDNFIYTASHDLKAPIANIEGIVNLLTKELKENNTPKISQLLNYISSSIIKLRNVLSDLTEITKVQRNLEIGKEEEVDIRSVLEEVDFMLHEDLKRNCPSIDLNLEIDNIVFSKINLRTILYNLIANALKYRAKERSCKVKVSTKKEGSNFVLSVEDNGIGIQPEYHHKIFGLFKRLRTDVEGTGVGLYIVKRIVENVNGEIKIESEPGKGSLFTIYIPEKELEHEPLPLFN